MLSRNQISALGVLAVLGAGGAITSLALAAPHHRDVTFAFSAALASAVATGISLFLVADDRRKAIYVAARVIPELRSFRSFLTEARGVLDEEGLSDEVREGLRLFLAFGPGVRQEQDLAEYAIPKWLRETAERALHLLQEGQARERFLLSVGADREAEELRDAVRAVRDAWPWLASVQFDELREWRL